MPIALLAGHVNGGLKSWSLQRLARASIAWSVLNGLPQYCTENFFSHVITNESPRAGDMQKPNDKDKHAVKRKNERGKKRSKD